MREQAIDADVAEPGDVEEGEEPLERPHHVADACRPLWRRLDHEPPDVVHSDRTESTPANPVEVDQEMADLTGPQPHRSRSQVQAHRPDELFQDFTRVLAEATSP